MPTESTMCKHSFKKQLVLFFFLGSFLLSAQKHNLYGCFEHDSIPGLQLSILDGMAKLEQFDTTSDLDMEGVDCIVGGDCLLEETISCINDTLYIDGKPYFKIMSTDMILSLQNIRNIVHNGDTFYCTKYYDRNNNIYLLGSIDGWKNGQKNGRWIYLDHARLSGIIFKDGVIVDTFAIRPIDVGFGY